MIRRANAADVTALVEMARAEHALSQLKHTPFDEQVCIARFDSAVSGLGSVVFVSEKGGRLDGLIAGAIQPNLHNRYCTVYELLWFSTGSHGLRLLEALKNWANRMRATALVVHNYAGISEPEKFTRVMARRGFAALGASYTMTLEN